MSTVSIVNITKRIMMSVHVEGAGPNSDQQNSRYDKSHQEQKAHYRIGQVPNTLMFLCWTATALATAGNPRCDEGSDPPCKKAQHKHDELIAKNKLAAAYIKFVSNLIFLLRRISVRDISRVSRRGFGC